MAVVSYESFADVRRAGIVERHTSAVCTEPHHLVESVDPYGSSRLQSSINFGSRN